MLKSHEQVTAWRTGTLQVAINQPTEYIVFCYPSGSGKVCGAVHIVQSCGVSLGLGAVFRICDGGIHGRIVNSVQRSDVTSQHALQVPVNVHS
jgi:hypothetical protein